VLSLWLSAFTVALCGPSHASYFKVKTLLDKATAENLTIFIEAKIKDEVDNKSQILQPRKIFPYSIQD
jgi:hypothetical protein